MARPRIEFHDFLKNIISDIGDYHLYFQEPSKTAMKYPCIRYKLAGVERKLADNGVYVSFCRYQLIIMSWDIEDPLPVKLMDKIGFSFENAYDTDNLHHWVFNYYY